MRKNNKIVTMRQYKQKGKWNLGIFFFGIIFIYILVTILTYVTKDRITVYEVKEGSILKDKSYKAIAVREENVVTAESDGYINFFKDDDSKMGTGKNAYTISNDKITITDSQEKNEEVELSTDDWDKLLIRAQSFNGSFKNDDFRQVYNIKNETRSIIESNTTQKRITKLQSLLEQGEGENVKVFTALDDGIIEYTIDGFEAYTLDDYVKELKNPGAYNKIEIENNMKVKKGSPVYRLITNEKWGVMINLDKQVKKKYKEDLEKNGYAYVKVKFKKDNEIMIGKMEIVEEGKDGTYALITFSDSAIRYAQDRFLDIELVLQDVSGLKIPKTAVTEKQFFVIPVEFLTYGGAGKQEGVLMESKSKKDDTLYKFQPLDVFAKDTEKGMAFIDMENLKKGDVIMSPDSGENSDEDSREIYVIGEKMMQKGAYNVNKGYAVLKQVNILSEGEDYYIIKEGNEYGLKNYDYIAEFSKEVTDDAIINQ